MRIGFFSALVALALAGVGIASCTQDFDQFEPTGGGGAGGSGSCGAGEKSCNGACVAIDDPAFGCGTSCTPCNVPNANAACQDGACIVATCNGGFQDCDGLSVTGCEADTSGDPGNCGACGTVCTAQNAAGACNGGQCGLGPCSPGFGDCDNNPANGCEAPLNADPDHCGTCGKQCAAFETCMNGQCATNPCDPGKGDCDNDPSNGCETDLGTLSDCGFCGDACNFPNASGTCEMGTCTFGACAMGFDDCDNNPANGCEADLGAPENCGACGNMCPAGPNSTATCMGGTCGIMCAAGFGDCDGNAMNGCETNLGTSVSDCGACGHACSNTNAVNVACMAGSCAPSCGAGYGDCMTPAAPAADDGCETNTDADVTHCGACGRACAGTNVASKSCAGGVCDSTCDIGFANCSMPAAPGADNGCELNVLQDDLNCGGCGNDCSGTLDCDRGNLAQKYCGCSVNNECGQGGSCGAGGVCSCNGTTCAAGENCGGGVCQCNGGASCGAGMLCCQMPAGCVDPTTDPMNCGACGRACADGFTCAASSCRCDADADCNGGSAGTCNMNGQCSCGGVQCAIGERCLANGTCG